MNSYQVPGFATAFCNMTFDRKVDYMIVGSYRRGKSQCSDVDLLFFAQDTAEKVYLERGLGAVFGWTQDLLNPKMRGVWGQEKFDCNIALPHQRGSMMLHTTGSAAYNERIRSYAKQKGWLLNQYGLFTRDREVVLQSAYEEDIIMKLDSIWLKPEDRII
jgi:DNA polymerase (family 10)